MSFFGYCLFLILYLHAFNARHLGTMDKGLCNNNYLLFDKGSVLDLVEREIHQKALNPTYMNASPSPSPSEEKEGPQGNDITTSSPQMVLKEAAEIREWKRQARKILLDKKSNDAEEKVDSKGNDGDVEDVVVMDYTQPHRKTPIHNKDP